MNSKMEKYDPQKLDTNIQNYWEKNFTVLMSTEKMEEKYMPVQCLIHLANFIWDIRNYTTNDVIARWRE